ncbi:hypothetical protein Y1Q_0002470 [Alligator mississippiensis]|uniref:Uncharacterized protein n=1 Tax=Alligator mississippiensis TaxID=8496 RepID=A0A151NBJ5_ALLMI|nr:hypothetical protein Y1Q_0002470 [Alligator mississippiensis]
MLTPTEGLRSSLLGSPLGSVPFALFGWGQKHDCLHYGSPVRSGCTPCSGILTACLNSLLRRVFAHHSSQRRP